MLPEINNKVRSDDQWLTCNGDTGHLVTIGVDLLDSIKFISFN